MLHALNMLLVLFFTVRDKMYDCAWPMVLNIHDRYNTTVHLTMSHGSVNMFKIFQKRQIMLLKSICLELMQEPLRNIPNWGMYVSNHSRTSTKVTNVHVIYHLKLLACPGFYLLSIENERHPSTLYLESKSCKKPLEIPLRTCLNLVLFAKIYATQTGWNIAEFHIIFS